MKQGRSGKIKGDPGRDRPVAAASGRRSPRQAPPALGAGFAQSLWPAAILIFLAVIVFYLPALRGGFIWDDDDYVTQNLALRTLSGLGQIWFKLGTTHQYYPLVFSSFWLEYHLWELQPLGYHLVNALLHAGSAVLLWLMLRRLGVRGAWLAGLLFAVHPVAAESVAWITERKNVLSTFFYLLSFMAMVRFYGLGGASNPDEAAKKWRNYGFALLLFGCALCSKTVTCSLPVALIIVLWWQRGRLKINELLPLVPFFALGAAMGLLTAWMEKHFVSAQGVEWRLTPLDRCLLAGRAVWFYLAKLACPAALTFIYPRWKIDAHAWWQYLYPLALLALFVTLWLGRRRLGRGPLAALAFFVVTLFPALGFVDVYPMRYSFVADHFQYLAMLAPLALAGAFLAYALSRLAPAHRPKGIAALAALFILLGALTWSQGYNYKDFETVWRSNLARNPKSFLAMNNLGVLAGNRGEKEQAIKYFEDALRENPNMADAHNNLAGVLSMLSHNVEAMLHYREAERLNPADASIPCNKGSLLIKINRIDEAVAAFQKALEVNPDYASAHYNLAAVQAGRRQYAQALEHYRRAHQLLPDSPQFSEGLAWLLATAPDAALRNGAEAVTLAEAACRATGGREPLTLQTLAMAYAEAGRFESAVQAAQQAMTQAQAAGQTALAQATSMQLRLYQARRPFHEAPAQR